MKQEILQFKLINGEYIISKISKYAQGEFFTLDSPANISIVSNEKGLGASLFPLVPFSKEQSEIQLFVHSIAAIAEPSPDLQKVYLSQFHPSDIILPEQKILLQ